MRLWLCSLVLLLLLAGVVEAQTARETILENIQTEAYAVRHEPTLMTKLLLPWHDRADAAPIYNMFSKYWNDRFRPSRYHLYARTECDWFDAVSDHEDLHGKAVTDNYNELGFGVTLFPGFQVTGFAGLTTSWYGEDEIRTWRLSYGGSLHIAPPIHIWDRKSFPEVEVTWRDWGWCESITADFRLWWECLGEFYGEGALVCAYAGVGYHHHWGDFGNDLVFTSPGNYEDTGFGDVDMVWGAVGMFGEDWALRVDFRWPGVASGRFTIEWFF